MYRLCFLLISLCVFAPPVAFCQEVPRTPAAPVKFVRTTATLKWTISASNQTKRMDFKALIPQTIPGRQRIHDIQYSIKPTEIFDKDGDRFAQFIFTEFPEKLELVITIDAELERYDFGIASTQEKLRRFEKKDALKKWLVDEKYLEKDAPEIQAIAKTINGTNEEQTLRLCFDYVLKNMKRGGYDDKDRGALWAVQQRKGDCSEYADLFVALCRAKGIPARTVEGYLCAPVSDTPKHNWAEVYTEKFGWVPFDPMFASSAKTTTFSEMRPIYLLLEVQRQNALLSNYHFWAYRYQGPNPVNVRDEFSYSLRKDPK